MNARTLSRLKLLMLAALFIGPMVAAIVVYYGPDEWKPHGNTAVGHLVTPARPLPDIAFRLPDGSVKKIDELWTVLHVGAEPCAEACQQRLWQTRQMRTLLHRRRGRVQRAYLVADPSEAAPLWTTLEAEHPRLMVLSLSAQDRDTFNAWLGALPVADPVLLIDPLGNWLMYYGDDLPLKGMLGDIKRVLKLSNIG